MARSPKLIPALFRLGRTSLRQSTRLGKAVARRGLDDGQTLAKAARIAMSGVARPAPPPPPRPAGGRWYEGRWGPGPLAMRHYRLFIPTGATARRPLPLLVLLHGCAQDAATFAASTHAARTARDRHFAVLMPEQAREANPQRCWNWFGTPAQVELEVLILMSLVERVQALYPRCRGPLFALGISAGGAIATTLALHRPTHFTAVGSHSGAAPGSAVTPLQAAQAMQGRRSPDLNRVRDLLRGSPPPPLILIHGDADGVVAPGNASATADLWRATLSAGTPLGESRGEIRRGTRLPCRRHDWRHNGRPWLRVITIHGLGHAWSGGAAGFAFSEPRGPDALKLAWQFFAATMEESS